MSRIPISVALIIIFAGASAVAQPVEANLDYTVTYIQEDFQDLPNPTLIPSDLFVDSFRNSDHDDGAATGISVGFPFEYGGRIFDHVNVSVNGWISMTSAGAPLITNDPMTLFSPREPNNTVAPYFADHYYRTMEAGYTPSRIQYQIASSVGVDFHHYQTTSIEWQNLNSNNKSDPSSTTSFILRIIQNPHAFDSADPDARPIFEFVYGHAGAGFKPANATAGAEDSTGSAHINALFESSQFNGDSTSQSTTGSSCWPPAHCISGIAIRLEPKPSPLHESVVSSTRSRWKTWYSCEPGGDSHIHVANAIESSVEISIVNTLGCEVARLYSGPLGPGEHSFTWRPQNVSKGVYAYVVQSGAQTEFRQFVLAR